MSGFKFDPSQPMLRKTLREYEEKALRYLWETGEEGAKSLLIWKVVNERLYPGGSISRGSIIVAMNRLVDQDVLVSERALEKEATTGSTIRLWTRRDTLNTSLRQWSRT